MLQFKEIEMEDFPIMREYFEAQTFGLCDYSIGAIYMWKGYNKTKYCEHNGFLVMRFEWPSEQKTCFSFPISKTEKSKEDLIEFIGILREHAMQDVGSFFMASVPIKMKDFLEKEFTVESAVAKRAWSDYVYNYEDLSEMKGRKYSGKRNHINSFIKNYPGYEVKPITKGDVPGIKAEYERYFLNRFNDGGDDTLKAAESEETILLLEKMHELGMTGIFIRAAGRLAGFSIGEIVGNTLLVHVEKALTEFSGIYTFVCREYARAAYKEGVEYINREEDVGSEGLRKSKLSYHPAFLLEKYLIEIA